ncbi:MAG: flippase-like domain-containing protein [Candidatus Bathyarchaeia archaeon]
MSEPKLPFKKWVYPVAAVGLILFLLNILFYGDFGDVVSVIGTANLAFYALAFCCVLGSILSQALAWKSMLRNMALETKFRRVFNLCLVGNFVDALVPGGWAGDIFKAYLLSKDQEGSGAKAAASIVLKNVIELLVTLAALVSGIVLLALNYTLEGGIMIVLGGVMFLMALPLAVIVYLSVNINATTKVMAWLSRVSARIRGKPAETSGISGKLQGQLQEFHDGIMMIKSSSKSLLRPVLFQVLAWVFDILTLFAIFTSLGYMVGLDKLVITNTLVVGLQTQGMALVGFAQIVSSTVYTVLGISPILAMASSLLAGFASFWFKAGVSFFAFQRTVFAHRGSVLTPTAVGVAGEGLMEAEMPNLGPAG